jgi:hypothetical protein
MAQNPAFTIRSPPTQGDLAYRIFTHAKQFEKASMLLAQQIQSDADFMLPCTMMGCFVFELYLKCLIVIETGSAPRKEHNYLKLFEKLSAESKAKIKEYYDKNPSPTQLLQRSGKFSVLRPEDATYMQNLDLSFDAVLAASKNAFQQVRYIYEEGQMKLGDSFFAGPIIGGTLERIKELRPQWFPPDPR